MNEELRTLLIIISVSVPVGLGLGLLARKKFPASCKKYSKFCLGGRWKLFAFGLAFFAALAALSFANNRIYFGWFFVAFAALELWALVVSGSKSFSKEISL